MPELGEGQVLVKATYISVDPYMRGRMNDSKSYVAGFQLGAPMRGGGTGIVEESKDPSFSKGDAVTGSLPWYRYQAVAAKELTKIDTKALSPQKYLSSAQYSGLSSYLPIVKIGKPKAGETAFVSGGAGAVGSCAVQVFKALGCEVVACAGSADKIKWRESLGVRAFNYKDKDFAANLRQKCPKGIDIYFDNVGGPILEEVLNQMNNFGRIICCGQISQYNTPKAERYGVKSLMNIVGKRLLMQGYIVTDYYKDWGAAQKQLLDWIKTGKLVTTETILEGFERIPDAFAALFSGKKLGKMLVKV